VLFRSNKIELIIEREATLKNNMCAQFLTYKSHLGGVNRTS